MKKDGWRLRRMHVHYCEYGEHAGKHSGTVEFENENKDSFVFQLAPERVDQYMDLIRDDVIETAGRIGELLATNLQPQTGAK